MVRVLAVMLRAARQRERRVLETERQWRRRSKSTRESMLRGAIQRVSDVIIRIQFETAFATAFSLHALTYI